MTQGTRSTSTVRAAVARDYDRKKLVEKREVKFEKDYDELERRMISRAKWHQRAENNNLLPNQPNTNNQDRSKISLEDFIERERIKQENIINSKRMGNERIRRSSINSVPKG